MKTPASPEIIAEVQKLLALAMSTPAEVADVFVDYYSHTGSVSVRCRDYGWVADMDASQRWDFYSDDTDALQSVRNVLAEVSARIERLRNTPKPDREIAKAKQLRETAAALLAQADELTAPAAAVV